MNPFSFKITPILCLEIAWENSTAAAKRAGKLAVYNQKVSLFSGTSLGLLLKKAWSHLCPYRCQKFVLTHSTKGKARENSHWLPWCLLFDPGGCRVPEKIFIPGHNQFPSHRPRSSNLLFVALKEGNSFPSPDSKTHRWSWSGWVTVWWPFEVYLPLLQRSRFPMWAANTAVCSLPICSTIPANYIIMEL